MSTEEAKPVPSDQPAPPKPTPAPLPASKNHRVRNVLIAIAALVLLFIIVPRIVQSWHTVSTDDAYVNSYVTFVAPRIIGQVTRVLVEDNNRVKKVTCSSSSTGSRIAYRSRSSRPRSMPPRRTSLSPRRQCAVRSPRRGACVSNSPTRLRTWIIRWP